MARDRLETRPPRPAPPAIGRYAAKVFADLARETRYADPALAERWPTLAGPALADLCRPGKLTGARGGTLEVFVPHGAAAARVQFEAEALRRRLNDYLGPDRVGRILVRQAGAPASRAKPQAASRSGEASPLDGALARFRASASANEQK
ncbi:DUF721 domain-containing protein [Amphiplicatus metriothermophilus]|uniref:DUF721 domain-containing protein n=1 Tax=Amphiplicatus metriothermophilus TaxID=1519374 RepID=A0A239PWZ0_9PROT|nr:DUF721 domain-containing protein [Amphiplicatus metriothermophilus]MBB5518957.1 hypothetical protein [Amphiplicatus metriothermophilus]SNT74543.1 hypothetical protein SAMN06297382_2235 [Amphiplicatus metriothermophilus]